MNKTDVLSHNCPISIGFGLGEAPEDRKASIMSTAVAHLGAVGLDRGFGRSARSVAPRAQSLRITRRGRLAVTCAIALSVVLVMTSLLSTLTPAGATGSVVVEPGMTLTQIAQEHLPGVPLGQAIVDIQRANKLSTTSIAVGQELRIP